MELKPNSIENRKKGPTQNIYGFIDSERKSVDHINKKAS